jgi:hypothetical protein
VTNHSAPFVASSISVTGNATDVKVVGTLAYVAAGTGGLRIFNVANPVSPQAVGSISLPGTAWDVDVSAGFAYVAAGPSGLHVVDVSNPATPVLRGSVAIAGTTKGVAFDASRNLAVAVGTSGLSAVNVANPSTPQVLGSVNWTGDPRDVALKGVFAFVADMARSLSAIDMTNPAAPVYAGSTVSSLGGLLQDVAISGDFVLGADVFFVNGVPIVHVGNAPQLSPRFILNFPPNDARGFRDDNATGIAVDAAYVYFTAARDIQENGVSGDARLYIGQYRALTDAGGIPPTVQITSPAEGATFVEGSIIPVQVSASDDVAVAAVNFLVEGASVFTATTEPYQFGVTVPAGVDRLTLGATAVDLAANIGTATNVVVNVAPDPGTTVSGRAVDAAMNPLPGLTATTIGISATTGPDGTFTIPGVPTIRGNISVFVSGISGGLLRSGTSPGVAPVVGGTTSVGDVVTSVGPILVNFENIPGVTPMGNAQGSVVPLLARLDTQLQNSTGARFSSLSSDYVAAVNLGVGHATSGTVGIGGVNVSNVLFYNQPVVVTFSVPGSPSVPAVTNFVSIRADNAGGGGAMTLQAFDINGVLIGTASVIDVGGPTVSLSLPNIHSIRVTQAQSNIAFDDLRFNPVTAAPGGGQP